MRASTPKGVTMKTQTKMIDALIERYEFILFEMTVEELFNEYCDKCLAGGLNE